MQWCYNPKKAIRNDAKWCQVMPRISASVKEAERQLRRAEKAARKEGRRPGRKRTQAVQVVQESRSLLGHRVSRRQKVKGTTRHRWAEPQCQQLQNAQPVQYFQTDWCVHCDGNRYSTVMYCMELGTRTCDIGHTWRPKYCWRRAVVQVWEDHPARAQKKWGISEDQRRLHRWEVEGYQDWLRLVEQLSRSVWSISMYIDWSRF